MNIREELAELEHEQWISWSKYVAEHNDIPKELLEKWEKNWKPYPELDEKTKDSDRIWADKVLKVFREKIQNAQKRIKKKIETIKCWNDEEDYISVDMPREVVIQIVEEIFKEEFNEKISNPNQPAN